MIIWGNSSKTYIPNYPNTNVLRIAWSGEIKNLAHFFKKRKIRVNAISPGHIWTKYHKTKIQAEASKNNMSFEAVLAKKTDSIPRGSYGAPEDVGNLVSFLISNKSKHLNASNILLDGCDSNAY